MSIDLVNLSYKEKNLSSSEKSVLVRLAWHADITSHECFPSIKSIANDTSLDRKTVQQALVNLVNKKLIKQTGEMKGRTKLIPVYKITLNDPNIGTVKKSNDPVFSFNDPENGTNKRSQKRDMERLLIKGYKKGVLLSDKTTQEQKQEILYYLKNPQFVMRKELQNLIIMDPV